MFFWENDIMQSKLRFSSSLFTITLMALAGPASAYVNGSENVTGSLSTPQYGDATLKDNAGNPGPFGPFGWDYSYTRGFDGTKLYKHLEIDFVFDAGLGYTAAQQTAYKAAVEANIEGIWNNKFEMVDPTNGKKIPITVDVTTAGPFNQTVNVHAGTGRADMINWYVNDSAGVNAHEFGHMLGLYDEYIGGAVDKYPNPTLSNDGLMGLGALNAQPVMYSRYYEQYKDYMNTLNPLTPGNTWQITAVPEPEIYAMLLIGLGLVSFVAHRGKQNEVAA